MEQDFGKGAVITPTIKKMPTLPRASVPFDWSLGFSTRELVTKNQNGSGSCGGQAVSYKGEADIGLPLSARFPYSQVYAPGGGSSEPQLIKIVVTEGLCRESILSSYDSGNPPSELFMENSDDITPEVLLDARSVQGTPVYVDLSFEGIAEAVRDNNGIIIGLAGQDNGTWLSADPQAPVNGNGLNFWYHWLFVGKSMMRNGKKVIGVKNSWGAIGENNTGWQYITEDYMPFIFSAWTFQKSRYKFYENMRFGQNSEDVFALQARLGIKPTGWFGPKTLAYIMSYQKKNKLPTTGFVGPLTRGVLNST